ncbi:MAG: thermonuclease family protein [Salaquimonas sp.]
MRRPRKRGFLRRSADLFTTAVFLLVIALAAAYFGELGETKHIGRFTVVDGDSLRLDGQEYRLEGIDAPEYRQICNRDNADWACGRMAATHLRQLINKGEVVCRGLGVDKYERILARCSVGDLDINGEMVREGWAVSFGGYFSLEAQAKSNKSGIWSSKFDRPQDWREFHSDVSSHDVVHNWMSGLVAKARLLWVYLVN